MQADDESRVRQNGTHVNFYTYLKITHLFRVLPISPISIILFWCSTFSIISVMSAYFIFGLLRLSPNQGMHTFSYKKWEALVLPTWIYSQILGQGVDVAPGINYHHFNYIMELALLGVPHTIERSCASAGLTRPTKWTINFCYMQLVFRRIYLLMIYFQKKLRYERLFYIWTAQISPKPRNACLFL